MDGWMDEQFGDRGGDWSSRAAQAYHAEGLVPGFSVGCSFIDTFGSPLLNRFYAAEREPQIKTTGWGRMAAGQD